MYWGWKKKKSVVVLYRRALRSARGAWKSSLMPKSDKQLRPTRTQPSYFRKLTRKRLVLESHY